MATGESYSAESIEQLLRCAICLDRYRQPKLLPCQHTFCESPCLEGLVRGLTRSLKCPECRAEHFVPYQGVSAYPNNLTIKNFLDLPIQQGGQNETRTETNEGYDNQANSAQDLYFAEAAACCASKSSSAPEPAPSSRYTTTDTSAHRSGCAVCARQVTLIRCAHCDRIVCEQCQRSHIDQVKSDVNRLVGQIRRGIPVISDAVSVIERKSEQIRQRAESAKSDITETIERYIMELRGRQRLLHSEVEMFLLGEVRSLRMHQENLEIEMASIASFCDTTESLLSRAHHNIPDEDIVALKRQCAEHMDNIRNYEDGNYSLPRERNLQFIIEESRLSNAITNFGEVSINHSRGGSQDSSNNSSLELPHQSSSSVTTAITTAVQSTACATRTSSTVTAAVSQPVASIQSQPRMSSALSPPSSTSSVSSYQSPQSPRLSGSTGSGVNGYSADLRNTFVDNSVYTRPSIQDRRRHHYTDSRIASILGRSRLLTPSSSPSSLAERRFRSLSTGASLYSINQARSLLSSSRHDDYDPIRSIPEEPTRNRLYIGDDSSEDGDGIVPLRPSVRFDINYDDDTYSESSSSDGAVNAQSVNAYELESITGTAENKYEDKGHPILGFGKRGNDLLEFTWPRGIAVDSRENNIFVADSSNHRVHIFDSSGRFVKTFGCYGDGEGEFDCLSGIAVNSFGQIVISDRYNHRIQIFDHHGNFQLMFGQEGVETGQLLYPWGVSCDNMGFIYVCDKENHRVQVFQSNGRFVRSFGAMGHRVGLFENPHYLAVSPDNRVYVADSGNHRIQVFTMYGDFLFTFGSAGTMQGQMRHPKGIAIDGQGFVIVADSGNNRIQVFYNDGRFYCMFGSYGSGSGQFKGIEGVGILGNGNIVVCDRENHRVQIF